MGFADVLLPEFDNEMATTRRTLERVPEDKLGWQPHAKSMTMARLAGHLAEIPGWAGMTLSQDSVDIAPPGAPPYQPCIPASRKEILEKFDQSVAAAREAIARTSDEEYGKPWSLLVGGKAAFTLPKMAVLRSFVFSHNVHHRAQLGVYLRLNDIPVPPVYGPSADENPL